MFEAGVIPLGVLRFDKGAAADVRAGIDGAIASAKVLDDHIVYAGAQAAIARSWALKLKAMGGLRQRPEPAV